jgi:hypothetical protein
VPSVRRRLGASPPHRGRVWILSARYALIRSDQPIRPYHRPLTTRRATELSLQVAAEIEREFHTSGTPEHILIVAPPRALSALVCLVGIPDPPRVRALSESDNDWTHAERVFDAWGWP